MMKRVFAVFFCSGIVLAVTGFGPSWAAGTPKLPLIGGKRVVATVDSFPITLDALNRFATRGGSEAGSDTAEVLRRLINARLVIEEAGRIGIPDMPEVKKTVDTYARDSLVEELLARKASAATVSKEEIDRLYTIAITEWRINSLLFAKEADAKQMESDLAAGKSFDSLAQKAVAAGSAKQANVDQFVPEEMVNPAVAAKLLRLTPGKTTPVVKVPEGFVVTKLLDSRKADRPGLRAAVEEEATRAAGARAAETYTRDAIKKYAVLHEDLLKHIDLDASVAAFQKLLKDQRVLGQVKGEKPITVRDLCEALRHRFFHGVEKAIESKELNEKKTEVLRDMVSRRVLLKAALAAGIDKDPQYLEKVAEYRDAVVFDAFLKKAVAPGVTLSEDEVKTYYGSHAKDFMVPETVKLRSIAFADQAGANAAMRSLKSGTDFKWLAANADGQVPQDHSGLAFDGREVPVSDLPQDLGKAVTAAKPGDVKVYQGKDGPFYLIVVDGMGKPRERPYAEVREGAAKMLYSEKMKKSMEEYCAKLRANAKITVYLRDTAKK